MLYQKEVISLPGLWRQDISELQGSVCVASPSHVPVPDSCMVFTLLRSLVPIEHVEEHTDHCPYEPHTQSTSTYINNA